MNNIKEKIFLILIVSLVVFGGVYVRFSDGKYNTYPFSKKERFVLDNNLVSSSKFALSDDLTVYSNDGFLFLYIGDSCIAQYEVNSVINSIDSESGVVTIEMPDSSFTVNCLDFIADRNQVANVQLSSRIPVLEILK